MAPIDPTESDVVGRASEIVAMTCDALRVRRQELPDLRAGVTSVTGHRRVRADEREARVVVTGELSRWTPGALVVALLAIRAEFAVVEVFVAADAALRLEDLDRAAVVVAADALRVFVRADERYTGLRFVVEREVVREHVPGFAFMAELAVGGEVVVRQDRAEP